MGEIDAETLLSILELRRERLTGVQGDLGSCVKEIIEIVKQLQAEAETLCRRC